MKVLIDDKIVECKNVKVIYKARNNKESNLRITLTSEGQVLDLLDNDDNYVASAWSNPTYLRSECH